MSFCWPVKQWKTESRFRSSWIFWHRYAHSAGRLRTQSFAFATRLPVLAHNLYASIWVHIHTTRMPPSLRHKNIAIGRWFTRSLLQTLKSSAKAAIFTSLKEHCKWFTILYCICTLSNFCVSLSKSITNCWCFHWFKANTLPPLKKRMIKVYGEAGK